MHCARVRSRLQAILAAPDRSRCRLPPFPAPVPYSLIPVPCFLADHYMLGVGGTCKSATYDEWGRHKSVFCARQNGVKNAPKSFKNVQKRSILTSFAHFYVKVYGLECIRPALTISPRRVGVFQNAQNAPNRPKTANTYVECPRHKSFLRVPDAPTTPWGSTVAKLAPRRGGCVQAERRSRGTRRRVAPSSMLFVSRRDEVHLRAGWVAAP